MPELDKNELKEAFKEASREWLDEKFTILGKWTARGLGALIVYSLFYFMMTMHGWKR